MKLNQLKQDRLEIAREEYSKLINPVVKDLLGEYSTFEWVVYKTERPIDFWKKDLPQETVREELHKAMYKAMRDMVCESLFKSFGPTSGPSESCRVANEASYVAYMVMEHPEKVDADDASYRIGYLLPQASTYLWEFGMRRIAEKLDFDGDPDSLAVALNELYPAPVEYDFDFGKMVNIEQLIDNGCLIYCRTLEEAHDLDCGCSGDGIPHSSAGYLVATDEDNLCVGIVPIRPATPSLLYGNSEQFQDENSFVQHENTHRELPPVKTDNPFIRGMLKYAIEKETLVKIRYIDRDGEETVRLIRPDSLEEKTTGWYLDAYCTLREDHRLFFLPRIQEVIMTGKTASKDDAQVQNEVEQAKVEQTSNQQSEGPERIVESGQQEVRKSDAPIAPHAAPIEKKDEGNEQELSEYDREQKKDKQRLLKWIESVGFMLITTAFIFVVASSTSSKQMFFTAIVFGLIQWAWIVFFSFKY